MFAIKRPNANICQENVKEKQRNLRVPSKRVAIVSKNVFWGANSPFRAGIGKKRNRDFDLLTTLFESVQKRIEKKKKTNHHSQEGCNKKIHFMALNAQVLILFN